ncbi:MAG: chemotaxis protein CheA [Candidatus Marinimicrobia bacterium]|nr:chemotaxis protein CheA [Candidatus Neomarinimicrobiota bacterium]
MSVYDNLIGMEEVLDDFIVETTELLEEVNEELVDLESDPNPDNINKIFRAFHTFKGTCGFLGFDQAKDVAHVAEDLLNAMRNDELQPTGPIIDLLLEACDWFALFNEDVKGRVDKKYDIEDLVNRLKAVREGDEQPSADATVEEAVADAAPEPEAPVEVAAASEAPVGDAAETAAANGSPETSPNGDVKEAAEPAPAAAAKENGQPEAVPQPSMAEIYANLDGMEEILDEFVIEAAELLQDVNDDLVELESSKDPELVNRIFRAFHTFKGTCGFLGFVHAKQVAHVAENILIKMRNGELVPDGAITDALLSASDWFSKFNDDVRVRADANYDISEIVAMLEAAESGGGAPAVEDAPADNGEVAEKESTPEAQAAGNGQPVAESGDAVEAEPAVAEDADEPPVPTPAPQVEAAVAAPAASKAAADDKHAKAPTQTIRVDMERLENLMNLAGELVLNRNQLGQAYSTLAAAVTSDQAIDNLDQVNNSLGRITTEIQEAVMQMRMLPISNVFRKFPRVVRDLARDKGKEIQLELIGEETELDRSVIEAINDPLLHLVRNAADHGIEPPDIREASGKPRVGTITLEAAHQGNHIIIEISDDGKGMDADVLAAKAVEKGTITESEAESMTTREKLNLIFKPGFSTAAEVTDVSGRGVGMDVVNTNVSKLNGVIDIDTTLGKGSRFTIKLPLTLAIVTGLKVAVWDENFIIPFSSIIETVQLKQSDLTKVEDKWVIRFRDTVVNTLYLDDWFKVKSPDDDKEHQYYAVIVSVAQFRYALVVTGLKGQEEAVIKPLGEALGKIPGVAGGTIGGDGEITLILDVPELIHHMGLG